MIYNFRIVGYRYKVELAKNHKDIRRVFVELHPQLPFKKMHNPPYAFFQPSDSNGMIAGTIYLPINGIRLELVVHESVHLAHEICLRKYGIIEEENVALLSGRIVHAVMTKLWANPQIKEI